MSLAKRNNGCLECRMRRVRCDKAEPDCFKCRKKGIKCSGQGIECRFSSHMMRKPSGSSSQLMAGAAGINTPGRSPRRTSKRYRWVNIDGSRAQTREAESEGSQSPYLPGSAVSSETTSPGSPLSKQGLCDRPLALDKSPGQAELALVPYNMPRSSPRAGIEIIPPQARMLFDHFSNFIAAKMVVLDFTGNGYRQIILPLACQDEMVGRAVSVIAAFHLAQKAPHMRMAAEMGQQAILSRLFRDSLQLEPKRLFNLSTWATILVLLVGDTITGSNNYVHLLELLSCLAQSSTSAHSLSDGTKAFIMEQTRMFELFGFPLSCESKGLETLTRCPDYYLDFMSSSPSLSVDPEQYSNIMTMKDVIRQACELYRRRALQSISNEQSIELVERLQQTVLGLDPTAEGSHALVWAFFVAAAESTLPEHRDFFANRLKGLFECTGFGSIPLALDTLQFIWASRSSSSWTEIVTHERPILIM